jgi:predicted aconitase with swiveling domain
MRKNTVIRARGAMGPTVEGTVMVCPNSIQGGTESMLKPASSPKRDDVHEGESIAGKILVMPCARGSLGWSNYFHNAFLNGVGPIGYVFTRMDSMCATTILSTETPCVADFDLEQWDPCKDSGTATTCA